MVSSGPHFVAINTFVSTSVKKDTKGNFIFLNRIVYFLMHK